MATPKRFPTTRWTLVLAAGTRHDPEGAEAFERLCERYYEPLYAYLRRQGRLPDDAQDLMQGFVERLLAKEILRRADPARGRFRAFLLTSLKYYVANEHMRAAAAKRGGDRVHEPIDLRAVEERCRCGNRDALTPERLYDREWALAVLQRALGQLREEARAAGRAEFFDAVHDSLVDDAPPASYRAIGARFGMTETAVRVRVHRLRRRYRDLLRAAVAETVGSDREVEEELRYLRSALCG